MVGHHYMKIVQKLGNRLVEVWIYGYRNKSPTRIRGVRIGYY